MLSSYRVAEHLVRQGFTFYRHDDFGRDAESMDKPISTGEAVSNLRQQSFDRHASWMDRADISVSVPDGSEPIPLMNEEHLQALDQLYSQQPLSQPTADQQKLRQLRERGCSFDSEGERVPLGQLYWRMAGSQLPGFYRDGELRRPLYCRDRLETDRRPELAGPAASPPSGFTSLHRLVAYLDTQPGPQELQAGLEQGLDRLRLKNKGVFKTLAHSAANPLGSLDVLRMVEPVWASKPEVIWSTAVAALPVEGAIRSGLELMLPEQTPSAEAVKSLVGALEKPGARAILPELIRIAAEHPQAGSDRLLSHLFRKAREASRLEALDPFLDELESVQASSAGWELPAAYLQAAAFHRNHPDIELDPRSYLAPGARFNPLQLLSSVVLGPGSTQPELKLELEEESLTIGDQILFLEPRED